MPRESSLHGWGWKPPLEGYVFLIAEPHMPSSWAHSLLSPNRHLSPWDILSLTLLSLTTDLQSGQVYLGSPPLA